MAHQQSCGDGWGAWIADYADYLRAAGRAHTTISLRTCQLQHVARHLRGKPGDVTTSILTAWLASQPWQSETLHSYNACLRGFYRWAHATDRIADDPSAGLPVVRVGRVLPHPIPDQIWKTCWANATDRVGLMLRLAAEAGLRRGEIAQLRGADVIAGGEGPQLLVHGKGSRDRLVPISDSLAAAILWTGPGWCFPSTRGDGHLSAAWVGTLCSHALQGDWTLHSLRHRFASVAYRGSHDLRAIQELLGHASPVTTQRYVAVGESALRAAMMNAAS